MENSKKNLIQKEEKPYFDENQIKLIRSTVCQGAKPHEIGLFLHQCKRTKLDPFSRQIYFIKDRRGKVQIQTSIDGFRVIAQRSKGYQGQTTPLFFDKKTEEWNEVWTQEDYPYACKIGVLREGFIDPLYVVAKWDSYCPIIAGNPSFMWQKMPELMLAKVAEALALRKAFPNEFGGLYTSDEMAQSQETTPISQKKPVMKKPVKGELIEHKEQEFKKNFCEKNDECIKKLKEKRSLGYSDKDIIIEMEKYYKITDEQKKIILSRDI